MTCWRIFLYLFSCLWCSATTLAGLAPNACGLFSAVGVDRALLGSLPVLGAGYYHLLTQHHLNPS